MKHNILLFLTLLGLGLFSQVLQAHSKTDIVTLYNGDRVTGELRQLYGGLASIGTDTMGTVEIEWQSMSGAVSNYRYEVRTSSDGRYFGTLEPASRPGLLRVKGDEGVDELEWLEVVELRPVEETLAERIDVYLSAGYSYTKASGVAQTSLNTDVTYDTEKASNSLRGRTTLTDSDDDGNTLSNDYSLTRKIWQDRARFYRTFSLAYEDNDELDLDHRLSFGAGIGRYFIDTHAMQLLADAGLQGLTEQSRGQDEEQNVEIFISPRFSMWRFSTPELDLRLGLDLYPSLTEWGRVRTKSDLNLRWEIVEDLFIDVTAWRTTDNESESGKSSDYGVQAGIGWEY